MAASPSFGDRVRIAHSQETQHGGFAGLVSSVFGESIPSSSGVGPVIGDRGEDLALSIFFDDTEGQSFLRALSEPIAPASAKSKSRRSWFRLRG